jgi:hypothetical protein
MSLDRCVRILESAGPENMGTGSSAVLAILVSLYNFGARKRDTGQYAKCCHKSGNACWIVNRGRRSIFGFCERI